MLQSRAHFSAATRRTWTSLGLPRSRRSGPLLTFIDIQKYFHQQRIQQSLHLCSSLNTSISQHRRHPATLTLSAHYSTNQSPHKFVMATDSAKSSQANGDAVPNGLVDVKPSMDTSKVEDDPLKAARDAKKKEKEQRKLEAGAKAAAKKAAAASAPSDAAKTSKDATQNDAKAKKAVPVAEEQFVNKTVPGQKKDLSGPMSDGYNPIAVEAAWDTWWEAVGVYKPALTADGQPKPEGTFVIPLPPPNVTGALHIGHALTVAVQDCLVRWNRMLGKTVLYTPGYDHAGISTQSVVEKRLYKSTGQTRHDLGREDFLKRVWAWKDDYQIRITSQMRRLGASTDWSRVAFTMDDTRYKAVMENFCKLYEDGVIYRSNRLVNWCCQLNTTLSNIECETKELKGRELLNVPGYDAKERFEFGVLTRFAYQIEGTDEKIIVATTRPETMVGDTGIAVHPDDPRYTHLHGKFAIHPFINRRLPIVLDAEFVDMSFGTGAVKITPAHDPEDFKRGEKYGLEFINILNDDGTMNENAGPFAGKKRYHVRNEIIAALKEKGLYEGWDNNAMTIKLCEKSKDVIEEVMKPQWWVNCTPLAAAAADRTRKGEVKIKPTTCLNDFYQWMDAPQDWCISRQLWWGHRIPAYFVDIEGASNSTADEKYWVIARSEKEAQRKADERFPGQTFTLKQDEDVLDTWFSSGLWPFSTLGWPGKTPDFERFYPASLLETGWDILPFWVCRMMMLGIQLTGKVPFNEVFCHAMIRDAHGRKMSKSLGNVIDPIDVIEGVSLQALHDQLYSGNLDAKEITKAKASQKADFPNGIPQCGADALRFALCAYTTGGRDINLEILRVEGYRKFCNKLWNATKFAFLKFPDGWTPAPTAEPTGRETLVEQWILTRLENCATNLNKHLASRNFLMATQCVYDFWLYELCDIYIEAMKPLSSETAEESVRRSAQDTLYTCLDLGLRMLHPFMPFVTEELWQRLPRRPEDNKISIAVSAFPESHKPFRNATAENDFALVNACAEKGRSLAGVYNLRTNLQVFLEVKDASLLPLLKKEIPTVVALIKGCKSLEVTDDPSAIPEGCSSDPVGAGVVVHLLIKGFINVDLELKKADKKIAASRATLQRLERVLSINETPEEIKTSSADQLKVVEAEIAALTLSKEQFERMR